MRRMELLELHDHARFPARLRDLVTDAMQALWRFGNAYGAILPQLYRGLTAGAEGGTGRVEVLDLCSGGGGPWPRLARDLERQYGLAVSVCLTDKYPNLGALRQAALRKAPSRQANPAAAVLEFVAQPVDAAQVSPELRGFRTIFSSFHHLGPAEARAALGGAMAAGQGIGVFELAGRESRTMAILCLTPLLVLLLTPAIRPFRWSRIFWSYVVPVVPVVIWIDGLISCLRAYAPEELQAMVAQLRREAAANGGAAGYRWSFGEERAGLLPVTYVMGWPGEG